MKTVNELPAGPPPSRPGIAVEICDVQASLRINRDALVQLVRGVLSGEGVDHASISLALVDNATILGVNRRHLGHDWPTDVISFLLSEEGDAELTGELVVSAEMAVATATEAGAEPCNELALYVAHGLLHLCGYDDTTEAGAALMRRREDEVLAQQGFVNPFAMVGLPPSLDGARKRETVQCPG
jgi:probable rRNA maturation factor